MAHVTLFSRSGCHLCDEMKAVLRRVQQRVSVSVEEVDISTDGALEQQYGSQIPVLHVDGQFVARYRMSEARLLRRLHDD